MQILQPPGWPRPPGYANGVAARGTMVFVAGQLGWTPQGVFESDHFTDQVRQALKNTAAILAEAGARPEHIVRMTWYVTDRQEYLAQVKEGRRGLPRSDRQALPRDGRCRGLRTGRIPRQGGD